MGNWGSSARKRGSVRQPPFRRLAFERLELRALLSLNVGFDGIGSAGNLPTPDPIGAVGPYSFVEAVKSSIAIYDKTTGTPKTGGEVKSLVEFFSIPTDGTLQIADPVVVFNEAASVSGPKTPKFA